MLEQARLNNFSIFPKINGEQALDDQHLVSKYSMLLASLLDPQRYAWFHKDLITTN